MDAKFKVTENVQKGHSLSTAQIMLQFFKGLRFQQVLEVVLQEYASRSFPFQDAAEARNCSPRCWRNRGKRGMVPIFKPDAFLSPQDVLRCRARIRVTQGQGNAYLLPVVVGMARDEDVEYCCDTSRLVGLPKVKPG